MSNTAMREKVAEFVQFLIDHGKKEGHGDGYAYALGSVSASLELSAGETAEATMARIDSVMKFLREGREWEVAGKLSALN